MRVAALAMGIVLAMTPPTLAAQAGAPALDGAWRVVQVVTAGPSARTVSSPQPGLLIFSGRYYSTMNVTAEAPRPAPGDYATATADELRAVWSPFTANAGTFEASGGRMTRRPIVAKNPGVMAAGAFQEYSFRLVADSLWTTQASTETGPVTNSATTKYVRVR